MSGRQLHLGIACLFFLLCIETHSEEFVGLNPNQFIAPPLSATFLPGQTDRVMVLSEDKTIRILDTTNRSVIDSFRFEAGKGRRGELNTFSVSDDGERFAVGTFGEPNFWDPKVYVVSLPERRITSVLKNVHKRSIMGLVFGGDSNQLISAGRDGKVVFWDLASGSAAKQFSVAKTNPVSGEERYPLRLKLSPDKKLLACATNFGDVFLFDTSSQKQLWAARPHRQRITGLDWVGNKIVTASHDGNLIVLDSQQKGRVVFTKQFGAETNFVSLATQPGTSKVFWATGDWDNLAEWYKTGGVTKLGVLDIASGQSATLKRDKLHSAIKFSKDGSRVITCTGPRGNELSVYDTKSLREIASLQSELSRIFQPRILGNDGNVISWGNEYHHLSSQIPQTGQFDTVSLKHSQRTAKVIPSQRYDEFGNRKFTQQAPTKVSPNTSNRWQLVELPESPGKVPLESGKLNRQTLGDKMLQWALLGENKVYLSTDRGQFLFDPFNPNTPRELSGQIGRVSVNVQRDDKRKLLLTNTGISLAIWDYDTKGDPLINYVITDRDYVAWTSHGYYACSAGGERLVGWHVNNGDKEFASFFPLEKFSEQYFNETLIRQIGKDKLAAKNVKPPKPIASVLPASIAIVEPKESEIDSDTDEITIKVKASSKRGRGKISEVSLLINNHSRTEYREFPKNGETEFEFKVQLDPGEQAIQARVLSNDTGTFSESNQTILATYTPPNAQRKPIRKLHFLGIGIDDYEHFDDLNYCVSDVQSIAKILGSDRSRSLFLEEPSIEVLPNIKNKSEAVQAIRKIKDTFGSTDLLIVYWSGHGANDNDNQFHFVLPSCENPEIALNDDSLRDNGINANDLARELTRLDGHIVVLLGTCFSGKAVTRIEDEVERLGRETSRSGKGLMMISSAGSKQEAFEDRDLKSSRFAYQLQKALLGQRTKGLDVPCCRKIDGECIVFTNSMSDYLVESMKHVTKGGQVPISSGFQFKFFKLTKVDQESDSNTGGQK